MRDSRGRIGWPPRSRKPCVAVEQRWATDMTWICGAESSLVTGRRSPSSSLCPPRAAVRQLLLETHMTDEAEARKPVNATGDLAAGLVPAGRPILWVLTLMTPGARSRSLGPAVLAHSRFVVGHGCDVS